VGFRYTVHNLAIQYDVKGYVRNLPDGRVEVVMEGPDSDMNHLVEEIKQRMEGFVKKMHIEPTPATGEFQRFIIKH
jgi:acylphosphatase